jgi:ATP-dependent Clp protease ATP-binding subunit ClpA
MFERYTEPARRAIFFARLEATKFGSSTIESEHLLLGLMHDSRAFLQGLANASLDGLRKEIEYLKPPESTSVPTSTDLPLSMPLKRALAYGAEEAERLNHRRVGTEHLLLGLLWERDSFVPDLLHKYGINVESVRRTIAGQSFGPEGSIRREGINSGKDGGAEVSETHHSFHGHDVILIERLSLSKDGKTITYAQEIKGPGKSVRHTVDFDVS